MKVNFRRQEIEYENPMILYRKLTDNGNNLSMLMESKSLNLAYGRQSIIIPRPRINLIGKGNYFEIKALDDIGKTILSHFTRQDFDYCNKLEINKSSISGTVYSRRTNDLSEDKRLKAKNLSCVIRTFLNKFEINDEHAALYGAISYDFVRQFENIGDKFKGGIDFNLFLPTEVVFFDEIRKRAFVKSFEFDGIQGLEFKELKPSEQINPSKVSYYTDMDEKEYIKKVKHIKEHIANGDFIQCVLSRKVGITLNQNPLKSYIRLSEINPSPYSFFFNFGDEQLFGTSPELFVKVKDRRVEMRPIAGTIKRSSCPIEDAEKRIQLLTDEKERREHTMLVDLGRNDLSRVCENVKVDEFMVLEQYPNLYHIVSGVRGDLIRGYDSIDALLVSTPAGTLSGAPKVRAMKEIEELENSRRGYYGGCIGYLSFDGSLNTGITIRSVHVKDKIASVRAGSGIVYHSMPEKELLESKLKSEKILECITK